MPSLEVSSWAVLSLAGFFVGPINATNSNPKPGEDQQIFPSDFCLIPQKNRRSLIDINCNFIILYYIILYYIILYYIILYYIILYYIILYYIILYYIILYYIYIYRYPLDVHRSTPHPITGLAKAAVGIVATDCVVPLNRTGCRKTPVQPTAPVIDAPASPVTLVRMGGVPQKPGSKPQSGRETRSCNVPKSRKKGW